MNKEWELNFTEDEKYVHFKQIDQEGKVIMEFALAPPDYAKLYYALKDWFGD